MAHMSRLVIRFSLVAILAAAESLALAQMQPPRSQYSPMAAQRYQQPDTWYDFLLKQFNPHNYDYGTWVERRRKAFLEATVKDPHFDYSLGITVALLFVLLAFAKLWIDRNRERWVTSEMMTDIYNHDLYSREVAREAIEKYNRHIEWCNRVTEAQETGQPMPGSVTEVSELRTKLQEIADKLGTVSKERDKLAADLVEKTRLVTDLSLRLDGLSKKANENGDSTPAAHASAVSAGEDSDTARLMRHINSLQQQLYAERKKNERLKGA
jgi:hypothetical protein